MCTNPDDIHDQLTFSGVARNSGIGAPAFGVDHRSSFSAVDFHPFISPFPFQAFLLPII